jgi:hypothetical protein
MAGTIFEGTPMFKAKLAASSTFRIFLRKSGGGFDPLPA